MVRRSPGPHAQTGYGGCDMANRLAGETSPYLLQHSGNSVDWYPWGEEALTKARTENKPILLSIGYSACHWCHIMAHECFENLDIARFMNENFVNIKVDREERPDLDAIYMQAVQSITGSGGWPLTVFLTPECKPFFGGTYFPPEDQHGLPGFPHVLKTVVDAYRNRRYDVDQATLQIMAVLTSESAIGEEVTSLSVDALSRAYSTLKLNFDWDNGGFGTAPKFPQPMALEFLLRNYHRTHELEALKMVTLTLEKMATGGIYDQLAGGFHRYSTDHSWLVPHFEKMLYDNALLSRLYLQAFLVTGRDDFRRITEETLDYVLRDMTNPEGGFYSTCDADSEGVEGKSYLWTPEEIKQVLGEKTGNLVCKYYGVTVGGNFGGRNILHVTGKLTAELPNSIREAKAALLTSRQQRIQPTRDEKVITSWNGLMLSSLAEAARVLGRGDYLKAAVANGLFLLSSVANGPYLRHVWKDGQAKVEGFLEDYALAVDGLMTLHEATFSGEWLRRAIEMVEVMVKLFWDESAGTFYDTSTRHQALFIRPRNSYDNAIPSGSAAATLVLLKIARITGRADMERIAAQVLRSTGDLISRHPLSFSKWLCVLDYYLSPPQEIAIVGPCGNEDTQALMRVLYGTWLPNKVTVTLDPKDPTPVTGLALLDGKRMIDGHPTVYLCERFVCHTPVTSPDALRERLARLSS